jgi:tetratricopeptide (TPR) repeat protein
MSTKGTSLFITLCIIIFITTSVRAEASLIGSTKDTTEKLSFRDSVREHYLKHGAWRYAINSDEYGREIDSAIALSHNDAYLWQQRGMPYVKQMKYEIGMAYVDSAVKYDADKWLDYRAFLKCIFQKSYRSALADFEGSLILHPKATVMDHEYAFYMALCYLQLNQYDSAERCFTQCVANDRAVSGSWVHYLHTFYLGLTQYLEHKHLEAIANFDMALDKYPRFSDAKYYKAQCLLHMKQLHQAHDLLTEARADLNEGLTINEDNAIYERYPYQVHTNWIASSLEGVEEEMKIKTQ